MNYKISFWVVLILLILGVAYYFYTKPQTVELVRDTELQSQVDRAIEIIIQKDSLLNLYADSLQQAKNNVKVITKTVYKEQQQIITEPLTDSRTEKVRVFLNDFYESKVKEIGLDPSPNIRLNLLCLNDKETKGAELLISDYKGVKSINSELTKQVDFLTETSNLKQQKINSLNDIIDLKEKQIIKLENTKVPIISSRKWYTDVGIVLGSLAIGFTTGIIYANNR